MVTRRQSLWFVLGVGLAVAIGDSAPAQSMPPLEIPFVSPAPTLQDFVDEEPPETYDGHLARVDGFIQQQPRDGEPATQRTVAYLCYDDQNLIVVFVAVDSDPARIRSRLNRRDGVFGDDFVEITLDTFHDQRRGYVFAANSRGMQTDALWTEGSRSGRNFDQTFDTVWTSDGSLTEWGYVVRFAIPFKSLRFPEADSQTWGITLSRNLPRSNEWSYWPRVSSRIEGRLNQAAAIELTERISAGANLQLIPYGVFRSFRAINSEDPSKPFFEVDKADPDAGLDAKIVFKDSFVLDVALNPDFSQVESDEPQITVNERFEVLFPEKRPFFLENANYFRTPINLVFTRRIADPQFGARLTGKAGPWAVGALVTDDQSPGRIVPENSLLFGKRALFGTFRVSRDISSQSSIGVLYTDREFQGSHNRVGALDGRLKLGQNWDMSFQAATSSTRFQEGAGLSGPAYVVLFNRAGRQLQYNFTYEDISPGFLTRSGFVPRVDIRRVSQEADYKFRPEGARLVAYGPKLLVEQVWDHEGVRLDTKAAPSFRFEFMRQTNLEASYTTGRSRLRPQDAPALPVSRDFPVREAGFAFDSNYFSAVGVNLTWSRGRGINFVPPLGQVPESADTTRGSVGITVRPVPPLRIDNTYLLNRLVDLAGVKILDNQIFRSKWNWQFSKEMSVRVILQYDQTRTNRGLTFLETTRNLNADFLFTYLVNPWTALFVGYNSNSQNLAFMDARMRPGLARTADGLLEDSRLLFVKFSYLFRF